MILRQKVWKNCLLKWKCIVIILITYCYYYLTKIKSANSKTKIVFCWPLQDWCLLQNMYYVGTLFFLNKSEFIYKILKISQINKKCIAYFYKKYQKQILYAPFECDANWWMKNCE